MKRLLALAALTCTPAIAQTTQWEYATYTELGSLGVIWSQRGGGLRAPDLPGILKVLQCEADEQGQIGLLNCAGRQGWELVTIRQSGEMFFKRVRR